MPKNPCTVDGCDSDEPAYALGACGGCLHALASAYDSDTVPNEYGFVCPEFDECGSCIHSDHMAQAGM